MNPIPAGKRQFPKKRSNIVRIAVASLVFMALFFASLLSIAFPQSATDDWSMYQHDASHTGYSTSTAPTTNETLWNFTINGITAPSVADGKLYVACSDSNVYCIDVSNGALLWKFATGGEPSSLEYAIAGWVGSSPAVYNGKIYVCPIESNIYCLDASNGNLIWKYTTGNEAGASPAVADGKVYFGSWDNNIYCLDALNGGLVWKYSTDGELWSSAIVADGNVYVSGEIQEKIYAFGSSETSAQSPPTSTSAGSPTSEYVAELYAVAWVPPAETAAAAAAVTATAVGIAATVQASISNQVGTQSGKVGEKMIDLLPDGFKRWLEEFVSSKRKARVSQKTASALLPTKAEVLAYGVSLLVLTISFSYVKVNDITQVLYVLPTVLVTAAIVEFAKTFSQVVVARSLGVWTEHKLWYFGLAMLLVSTFIFGIPFSAPTRNVYYTPKLTKRLNAVVACLAILVTLAFGALFFGLLVSGFTLIGSTGLAMCIIMGFIDTFPVEPLNGKAIYQHNKAAWAAFFVFTLTIYVSWLLFF